MSSLGAVVVPLADKVPTDNDVVAGWTGFAVFLFLVVAVALLCWSFTRHLRKARTNFGAETRQVSIPLAGTPEGDAAQSEALLGADHDDTAGVGSDAAPDAASPGRHRGASES